MNTFIFAIGGTGARVLKSFIALAASDQTIQGNIIPIILDMDIKNGDTVRTLKMFEDYTTIQENAYTKGLPTKGLFRNKVMKLSQLGDGQAGKINNTFQLNFGNINQSFFDYYQGTLLNQEDVDFLESLYDNSAKNDPASELNLELHHGFKGNPNIGSVVFNNMTKTPEWKLFEAIFNQGDRVFIISSIFGGTGASGFPQLVKNIRASTKNFLKQADIGALVVQPYFTVADDSNSSIDSATFNSKTKSALTYYERVLDGAVNEIFYIADKPNGAIANNQGGSEQQNKGSVVELIGATAIVKFINNTVAQGATSYYEFGIKNGIEYLSLDDLYPNPIWEKFSKMTMIARNFQQELTDREDQVFAKELDLKNIKETDPSLKSVTTFFEAYLKWIDEMANNQSRKFVAFNLKGDMSDFLKGKPKYKGLNKSWLKDPYTTAYNLAQEKLPPNGAMTSGQKLITILYEANEQLCEKNKITF